VGDELLQRVDVVGHSRHQLAGGGTLKVGEGEPLQVGIDTHSQVKDETLAQRVADVQIAKTHEPQKGIDADQYGDHRAKAGEIALANHLVHDLPLKEGRKQAQAGVQQQQHTRGDQRPPIRSHVAKEAFQHAHRDCVCRDMLRATLCWSLLKKLGEK